jgi:DNA ligase-1
MKAEAADFKHIDWTNCWMSIKYDGIRAVIRNGVVLSKSLKPIPNPFIQARFGNRPELEGYDGELIVGEPNASDVYSKTFSGVMTKKHIESDVRFFVFDTFINPMEEFWQRYDRINPNHEHVVKVPQFPVTSEEEALAAEERILADGYEGDMLRTFCGPRSIYKFGRSTAIEATLLKRKPIEDFEALVIGYGEAMENTNVAFKDETGRTKRSTHAEGMIGKDTLGFLECRYTNGMKFTVGIFKGLKDPDLKKLWDEREVPGCELVGRWAKLQKLAIGEKDLPRHPRWIGWRHAIDM